MEQEIFKPVTGYEGIYEISNLGRVKSLPKLRIGKSSSKELVLDGREKPKSQAHKRKCS